MAQFETWLVSDLQKAPTVKALPGDLFSQDARSNLIGIRVMDGGEPATLAGTVNGYVIRADGQTVVVPGTLEGNTVSILLPNAAYAIVGRIQIVVRLTNTADNSVVTLGACVGTVTRSNTGSYVTSDQTLPDIEAVMAKIATLETLESSAAGSATAAAGSATAAAGSAASAEDYADRLLQMYEGVEVIGGVNRTLTAGEDLNELDTPGVYKANNSVLHMPRTDNVASRVVVSNVDGDIMQKVYMFYRGENVRIDDLNLQYLNGLVRIFARFNGGNTEFTLIQGGGTGHIYSWGVWDEITSSYERAMAQRYQPNGIAGLDSNGRITSAEHPTYTAQTGKPTSNQTPGFGDTFMISQIVSNGTGHVTAATDRTVKIPDAIATTSTNGLMSAADKVKLNEIEQAIADLQYNPMQISAFSVNPSTAEVGSTVTGATLSYTMNKKPTSATLDGTAQTIGQASGTIILTGLTLTANKTWTLAATDERNASTSKMTTLSFLNKAHWGVAAQPAEINSSFLLGLANGTLTSSKNRTISVNAGTDQYIWYAVPASFGTCSFTVGGFSGGFTKVTTITHTNASGAQASYDVYKSNNAALGETTVVIS